MVKTKAKDALGGHWGPKSGQLRALGGQSGAKGGRLGPQICHFALIEVT